MRTMVDEFIQGNSALQKYIDDYVEAQAIIQTLNNPSGSFFTGAGLGEPKYMIDISRFNGNWGRPQRDGPALRAIALMEYVTWLIGDGQTSKARKTIWPVIANDLAYTGQYWNQTGFDLWEEVKGSSFFTTQNQYRALAQGAQVAKKLGVKCNACVNEAPQVLCFLQSFWNGKTIVANTNLQTTRSGADANTLLGAISVFDIDAYCDNASMQPCNSKILASHKVLVDSFRSVYGINNGKGAGQAAAIGRYAEDVYYKGNPWYLTTLSAAEVLYDAVAQWKARHQLTVDDISYGFFKDIYPNVTKQTYKAGNSNSVFAQICNAATSYADGFVQIALQYTPTNGSLSEQFGRDDGLPLSAYDLTWSYASFITMSQRRSGQYPASWGTRNAAAIASTCAGTSTTGTYVPATAAGAPNNPVSCTVSTTFNVNASTYYGENIFLIGNTSDTGSWNPSNALPMDASGYTNDRPLWTLTVDLAAGEDLSYKYVRQETDQSYIYESINRTLNVESCNSQPSPVEDSWIGESGTPS
jgi:glucoamylase